MRKWYQLGEHIRRALRELAGIEDHPFSKKYPVVTNTENLHNFWVMNYTKWY